MARLILALSCLVAFFTTSLAKTVPETDYDVIVIGGGPAGLSTTSALCRVARRVVLFDSLEYRNAPTRNMHDVIGNDGTPPANFSAAARDQIKKYENVDIIDKKVTTLWSANRDGHEIFFAQVQDNRRTYTARRVVLATGVTDILPSTPGVVDAFGEGMYWCPWCDGYEHREQPLAVVGPLSDALSSALEMKNMNPDIIVLANGTDTPYEREIATNRSKTWLEELNAYNIPIVNATIARIERLPSGRSEITSDASQEPISPQADNSGPNGKHYDRFRVQFDNKLYLDRSAFLVNILVRQTSTLPQDLNLTMEGPKIKVDTKMRTSYPGIFAVGDANTDGSTNVPHAMYSGKKAAVVAHVQMAKEESLANLDLRNAKRGFMERLEEKWVLSEIGDELESIWQKLQA